MDNWSAHSIIVRYGDCPMPRIHAMYKQVPFANSLIDVAVVCNKAYLGITFLYDFSFI